MPNYVSTRVKAYNIKQATAQTNHDMRLRDIKYLRTQPDFNAVLYDSNGKAMPINAQSISRLSRDNAKQIMRRTLQDRDAEQRQRNPMTAKGGRPIANTFLAGVLTFSPDGIKDISTAELDKAAQQTLAQICAELHVKPVYLSRHNDEKTPHYHYMLEGTDAETGKAVASRINRAMCRRLQDIAAAHYAPLGLERGRSKTVTNANHMSILESHRAEVINMEAKAAKAEAELDDLRQQLATVKDELKRTRATAEERKRMDAEERAKLDAERRRLRDQQNELRDAIREAEEQHKRLTDENEELKAVQKKAVESLEKMRPEMIQAQQIQQDRTHRRRELTDFLRSLKSAGAVVWEIAKRYTLTSKNRGDWTPLPYTDSTKLKNIEGYADDLLKHGGEAHIKIDGTSPIFCLDDINPDNLARIKQDYSGVLMAVETSPNNYQVWLAWAKDDKAPKRPLNSEEWRAVQHYLVCKYGADRNADRAGHYYRLPGFKRVDNPDWTARIADNGGKIGTETELQKIIDIALPAYSRLTGARSALAQKADLELYRTNAPDWFKDKFLRVWRQYDSDRLSYSEVDWAAACNILRNAPEHQRLRYAGYIADILSHTGQERGKSQQYGDITAGKAYDYIGMER